MKCYCFCKFYPARTTTPESSIVNPTQPDVHVIITTPPPGDRSNPGGDVAMPTQKVFGNAFIRICAIICPWYMQDFIQKQS